MSAYLSPSLSISLNYNFKFNRITDKSDALSLNYLNDKTNCGPVVVAKGGKTIPGHYTEAESEGE